jgi:hypothetical protein
MFATPFGAIMFALSLVAVGALARWLRRRT